ncbi:MAG TPA: hypothetical protein VNF50_09220 [Acidimicrobiales bacterium]|nr:hypothetical protein [Acidimicrobiales bacterium]
MPGNLRDYHRYQRFPIYPRGRGGGRVNRAARRRVTAGDGPGTGRAGLSGRIGRWIVRRLGGPGGVRRTGSMGR